MTNIAIFTVKPLNTLFRVLNCEPLNTYPLYPSRITHVSCQRTPTTEFQFSSSDIRFSKSLLQSIPY